MRKRFIWRSTSPSSITAVNAIKPLMRTTRTDGFHGVDLCVYKWIIANSSAQPFIKINEHKQEINQQDWHQQSHVTFYTKIQLMLADVITVVR